MQIYFEFGPRGHISFRDRFVIFSSGCHSFQQRGMLCAVLVEGNTGNIFV